MYITHGSVERPALLLATQLNTISLDKHITLKFNVCIIYLRAAFRL